MSDDLNEHPFAVFMAGESHVSASEKAWLRWVKQVERLLGHSLDGDQEVDGYSLDFAHDAFCDGLSPQDYVDEVREANDRLVTEGPPKADGVLTPGDNDENGNPIDRDIHPRGLVVYHSPLSQKTGHSVACNCYGCRPQVVS